MEVEFGNRKNMLYRYLMPDIMCKGHNTDHPYSMLEELMEKGEIYFFLAK